MIKETIKLNQNKAMVVVNSALIINYYEIGVINNQRKTWGNKYIERLSLDLKVPLNLTGVHSIPPKSILEVNM